MGGWVGVAVACCVLLQVEPGGKYWYVRMKLHLPHRYLAPSIAPHGLQRLIKCPLGRSPAASTILC